MSSPPQDDSAPDGDAASSLDDSGVHSIEASARARPPSVPKVLIGGRPDRRVGRARPASIASDPSPSRRPSTHGLSPLSPASPSASHLLKSPVPISASKVQKLVGVQTSGSHNLREILLEGWLFKKNSSGITRMRGWHKRWFVLFPHSLCYWVTSKESKSKPPRGNFETSKISRVVQDDNKADTRFDIFCSDGRIIELKANTVEDALYWIDRMPGEKATASKRSVGEIMSELSKAQPPDGELNAQFEAFMEEKCFKPDARSRMRLLAPAQKWLLLCQEQAKSHAEFQKGPEHWFRILRAPKVSPVDVETLKVAISGSGKSWMATFVQIGALSSLLSLLGKDTTQNGITAAVLDVLKAFMNNEFGLNVILSTPHAIEQIALVLTFGDDNMCLQVIDLLLVTSWLSEDGHKSVMEALEHPRFLRRFKVLTDFLQRGENPQFKAKVMTFINALINALNTFDDRMYTRSEFMDLGMENIIEFLRTWVDKNRGSANFDLYDQIRIQCDLFDEEAVNDKREAVQNGLDLSDMDAVLTFMRDNFHNSGVTAHFLTALHHLMLVPSEKHLAVKMWNTINYILDQITQLVENEDADEDEEAYHILPLERLKELLAQKIKEQAIEEKHAVRDLEKEAEALRQEVHQASLREQQLLNKVKDLEAKLASGGSYVPAPDAPPLTGGPEAPPLAPLLGDIPVPPPLFDGAPVAPPLLDGVPMAPSLDGIPMAPSLDGIPMAPSLDGVPMAPSLDGVPMAPSLGGPPSAPTLGGFFSNLFSGPKLPPKKVLKPVNKMKAFHWRVVEPKEVEGTCWKSMDDETHFTKLDFKDFEEQFKDFKAKKKVAGPGDAKETKTEEKKELVQLLDPKRSYNINISLARFRMTHSKIRDAVLALDENVMDEERAAALINVAPTPEEAESIGGYDGPEDALGEAEKFFKCMIEIPRMKDRLDLYLFKLRFQSTLSEADYNLAICESSAKALKDSVSLKRVMEIILAFGNYLNGGTKKGQAYGFKLDTINKLKNTKATNDPHLTLLHYLVQTLQEKFPSTLAFLDDLKDLPSASRVELNFLTGEMNKLNQNARKLELELKNKPISSKDKFLEVMGPFHSQATKAANQLSARLTKLENDCLALAKFFGEDPKQMPMEELFGTFSTFTQDFKKATLFLEKKREQMEKDQKRKDAEAARKSLRDKKQGEDTKALEDVLEATKAKGSKGDEQIVDKVVNALTGNATGIRQMIRARRRKAGVVRRKTAVSGKLGKDLENYQGGDDDEYEDVSPVQGSIRLTATPVPAAQQASKENPPPGGTKKKAAVTKKKKLWVKHIDPDSGDTYFYNSKTGESTWEEPPNFPY